MASVPPPGRQTMGLSPGLQDRHEVNSTHSIPAQKNLIWHEKQLETNRVDRIHSAQYFVQAPQWPPYHPQEDRPWACLRASRIDTKSIRPTKRTSFGMRNN